MNRDQIKKYVSQDFAEKKQIQKAVDEDPFLLDALEGLEDIDANDLDKLDRRFKKSDLWINITLFSMIFLFFLLGSYYLSLSSGEEKDSPTKISQTSTTNTPKSSYTSISSIHSKDSLQNTNLDEKLPTVDSKSLIQAQYEQRKQTAESNLTVDTKKPRNERARDTVTTMPIVVPSSIELIPFENFGKETYLHDLLVLDYRYYRKRPKIELDPILNGLPASSEKEFSTESMQNELDISYMNFLSKTLLYFKGEKYRVSMNRINIILDKYPDDINALFYGAICKYKLKEYSGAISLLKTLKFAKFTNFKQDEEWYLLLCYKATLQEFNFNKLKEDIVSSKGYYSSKAKILEFR